MNLEDQNINKITIEHDQKVLNMNVQQYECNICLEIAQDPVITSCGHLYCWPCIYSWLNSNQEFLQCPVCKNGISQQQVIPLYTKDEENLIQAGQKIIENKRKNKSIPPRPTPMRVNPQRNRNAIGQNGNFINMNTGMNLQHGILLAGYGYFPSLFNLLFQVENKIDDSNEEHQSPEIKYQKKFQILLLTLFICLILVMVFLC